MNQRLVQIASLGLLVGTIFYITNEVPPKYRSFKEIANRTLLSAVSQSGNAVTPAPAADPFDCVLFSPALAPGDWHSFVKTSQGGNNTTIREYYDYSVTKIAGGKTFQPGNYVITYFGGAINSKLQKNPSNFADNFWIFNRSTISDDGGTQSGATYLLNGNEDFNAVKDFYIPGLLYNNIPDPVTGASTTINYVDETAGVHLTALQLLEKGLRYGTKYVTLNTASPLAFVTSVNRRTVTLVTPQVAPPLPVVSILGAPVFKICRATPLPTPAPKVIATCRAALKGPNDPIDTKTNVKWVTDVTLENVATGTPVTYTYKWAGAAKGQPSVNKVYTSVLPGANATSSIIVTAKINGKNVVSANTDNKCTIAMKDLVISCKAEFQTEGSITWTPSVKLQYGGQVYTAAHANFLWKDGATTATDTIAYFAGSGEIVKPSLSKYSIPKNNRVEIGMNPGLFEGSEKITGIAQCSASICPPFNSVNEESVRCYLESRGVKINHPPPQTIVRTLDLPTVKKLASLRSKIGVLTVNGGTEKKGHVSHDLNKMIVDLDKQPGLNSYVINYVATHGTTTWIKYLPNFGNAYCVSDPATKGIYVDEDPKHWHVVLGDAQRKEFMDHYGFSDALKAKGCY